MTTLGLRCANFDMCPHVKICGTQSTKVMQNIDRPAISTGKIAATFHVIFFGRADFFFGERKLLVTTKFMDNQSNNLGFAR